MPAIPPQAIVFDAYGTLFDVHSVVQRLGGTVPPALSILWRQKQLEYTWLRSLMGRYEDFEAVTQAALHTAASQLKIVIEADQSDALMQAYLLPAAYPEVKAGLESLQGIPLAILSNGTTRMLQSAVRHNGLEAHFAEVISVERVKTYKPSPMVYALGPQVLKLPANQILFISSNWWDAAGAKAFGYQVCWCNRSAAEPEHLGFGPDFTISHLGQLGLVLPGVNLKSSIGAP